MTICWHMLQEIGQRIALATWVMSGIETAETWDRIANQTNLVGKLQKRMLGQLVGAVLTGPPGLH